MNKSTYQWKCGLCGGVGEGDFTSHNDAAQIGIIKHGGHKRYVYVTVNGDDYVGLARGLIFNNCELDFRPDFRK